MGQQAIHAAETGHRQAVRLAVGVGNQITAFAHEGTREVDVAEAGYIKTIAGQVPAEPLVQQPAFPQQYGPAVHLDALQQPQGDALVVGFKLGEPTVE
jgi:hypothetical protein